SSPLFSPLVMRLLSTVTPAKVDHLDVRLPFKPSSTPCTSLAGNARTGDVAFSPYSHESLNAVRKTAPVTDSDSRSTSHFVPASHVLETAGLNRWLPEAPYTALLVEAPTAEGWAA